MAIKTKAKRPPLSALDKTLYAIFGLSGLVLPFVMIRVFGIWLPSLIAFAYPDVIASRSTTAFAFSSVLIFAPWLLFFLAIIFWEKRLPLLGNKKYKPKWSEKILHTPPLFSKQFFVQMSDKRKKWLKIGLIIVAALLLVHAIVLPFAFLKRTTVDVHGNIRQYDMLGRTTNELHIEDADLIVVIIDQEYIRGRYSGRTEYQLCVDYYFGDEQYRFDDEDFSHMNAEELFTYLSDLKATYGDTFTTKNAQYVDDLISHKTFYSQRAKQLLYQIFDLTR